MRLRSMTPVPPVNMLNVVGSCFCESENSYNERHVMHGIEQLTATITNADTHRPDLNCCIMIARITSSFDFEDNKID